MRKPGEISLPAAALRLKVSYQVAYSLILTGKVEARLENGRWYVSEASVQAEAVNRGVEDVATSSAA